MPHPYPHPNRSHAIPRAITKSVGNGGFNLVPDVSTVQDLLNLVPPAQGGPSTFLNVDGLAFGGTQDAIRRFQRTALGIVNPDGRVDPGGRTLTKLHEFEAKFGRTSFLISRLELRTLTQPRTADTADRFYGISVPGGTRKLIYFFSLATDRLANPADILPKLVSRAGETTQFSTKLIHSIAGFQAKEALHSERSSDANNARTALSLVLPDDLLNIFINHRWISATTQLNVTRDVRGQFRPIGEITAQS